MNDELILAIYNRLPTQEEIDNEIVSEDGRMVECEILATSEAYDEFINSQNAVDLDVQVTAIHNINSYGYILGN